MKQDWRLRVAQGALVVLVHLVVVAMLVRHAGKPSGRNDVPEAAYIALALVPAAVKLRQPEAPAATLPAAARKRLPVLRRQEPVSSVPAQVAAVAPALTEAEPEPAAPQGRRLDMDALRLAARQMEQGRVPTGLERLRESEQIRSTDDSPLVRGIQRAKRPKCQTAYSGGDKLNLIMLIPLALDTIRDKGCKW